MADALLLHRDVLARPGTSVSATNEVATMPAARLASREVRDAFRTTGLSTVIDIDAGENVTLRGLMLAGLSVATTGFSAFTVAASTSSAGDNGALDHDALAGGARYDFDALYRQAWTDFESTITARYIRVSLTAEGGSWLDIGRMFLGPHLPVTLNIGYPLEDGFEDLTEVERMANGRPVPRARSMLRRIGFQFGPGVTAADHYEQVQRVLIARHGQLRQVALIPDPTDSTLAKQAVLGRLEPASPGVNRTFGAYERGLSILEDGGIDPLREI